LAVHTIYGRVLLATFSPHHELLTVITVRPVCTCTRTRSCSIVPKETARGRQRSRVNESRTSQGVPPRAIPVNNGVRSPPLLVHPSRDSLSLLACTQFSSLSIFALLTERADSKSHLDCSISAHGMVPTFSPKGSLPVHHAADPYRIFGICATLYLYARYLGLAARFTGFTGCFSRMRIQPFIFRLILDITYISHGRIARTH